MKKINVLIIKSFIGPFILTFFLVLFILLMQFVFVYIDDLMGKGLNLFVILELLAYKSTNLVGIALPLAVLLTSIMSLGNLAEHFELIALKASGLSIFRILKGLIVLIIFISVLAFLFSNYVTPIANLKFKTLLFDVRNQKPLLSIDEGNFYNEMDNIVIRVDEKDEDNRMYDVLIYDHRPPNKGNGNVIRSKEAEMVKSSSGRFLLFELYDGVMYKEMEEKGKKKTYTHLKTDFEKMTMRIDLSDFEFKETDEEKWGNNKEMLNMQQLKYTADSLEISVDDRKSKIREHVYESFYLNIDSVEYETVQKLDFDTVYAALDVSKRTSLMKSTRNMKNNLSSYLKMGVMELESRDEFVVRYWNEWHRKLTLSVACLVLFFIGAPLGAIIKKGGLGWPVLISILIFLVFHITSMSGEKMARTGVLTSFEGMWLSFFVLLPFSIILSFQAVRDSSLLEKDTYLRIFRRMKARRNQDSV